MPEGIEKRRYPRVGLDASPISSEVWREPKGQSDSFEGLVTVLGGGGAFVELDERFKVGSSVGLRFTLPGAEDEVIYSGVVKQHVPGRGVGVEFTKLVHSDRERLTNWVIRARSEQK